MFKTFIEYIHKNEMISQNEKTLLAVSGGIDSVVMLHLFIRGGYPCGVAHCNFGLRGIDSDRDEEFVQQLAGNNELDFFSVCFNTKQYAAKKNISIQVAARDLRYEWLRTTANQNGYTKIATGHNRDDSVETFFINLVRGSGIQGLTGIQPVNNNVIRPLLYASREKITQYCTKHGLRYREDASNKETKYTRNQIRHLIIPELQKINPAIGDTITNTIRRLGAVNTIYKKEIKRLKDQLFHFSGQKIIIPITDLRKSGIDAFILYDLLQDYNFSASDINDMMSSLEGQSGKQFHSDRFRLIKDRNELIITPLKHNNNNNYYVINKGTARITDPVSLSIEHACCEEFRIPNDKNIACLDYEKINYPLEIRKWKKGDYFFPLGMKHRKKLSDYFSDHKFSIPDKENTWLLCTGNDIAWIIGHCVDDRFKITNTTKEVAIIRSPINPSPFPVNVQKNTS